jgi:enamine deaminase RidA (YjgF/YER057c/UK114 family)
MSFEIVNPEPLGVPRGWNHGLLAPAGGRILFIAGQTARDGSGRLVATDFVGQFAAALDHILLVIRSAGGDATDIGRFTIYVTDIAAYRSSLEPLGQAYRERMGRHFPAMALVEVNSLVDPDALVEIEATAVLG